MSVAVRDQLSIVRGEPRDDMKEWENQTIAAFAREVTARWAGQEALVAHTPAGIVRWTYADLWNRSAEVALALVANGIDKGSRVGILMSNRPEFIASVFGIALAGGVAVALNTFATSRELDYLLSASCVSLLLFESRVARKDFHAMLTELEPAIERADSGKLVSPRFPFLRQLVSLEGGELTRMNGSTRWDDFIHQGETIPENVIGARAATLSAADTAILFFSSGSTGLPKGILHNQRAVVLQWQRWPKAMGYVGTLRAWTANGFFWSGNFAMVIGSAFSTGGTLVLQSIFNPGEALELMAKERVNAPFAMLHQWGRIAEEPDFQRTDLSSLRFVDPNYTGLRHPKITTGFKQPQAFGCTETLTINTTTCCGDGGEIRHEGHGLPLPGNTLKIVDSTTGEIVPRGERGEIAVKGPTLMMAYLGKTNEECFDDEGFYHTGDGGYVDDRGWLFWEGRLTEIIKTGGANVSPFEVDEAITNYPGVKATQTVGMPHDALGEIVVSCVVPNDDGEIDVDDLQEFLKERLASYKVPRKILILKETELTLTDSGNKIKSAEVRKIAAARLGRRSNKVIST